MINLSGRLFLYDRDIDSEGALGIMKKRSISSRLAMYSVLFFVLYVAIFLAAFISQQRSEEKESIPIGIDYRMMYAAGETALSGNAVDVYKVPVQQAIVEQMLGTEMPKDVIWFYPPTFLLAIISLFSTLPFYVSMFLWLIATLILAVISARFLVHKQKSLALLTIGYPSVLFTARWGQNSFLSTSLMSLGIAFMESKPVLSGLFFGLLTYKPQLAVFPFLILLVTKKWKVFRWSVFFTLVTVLCSVILFGVDTWLAFFQYFFKQTPALLSSVWIKTAAIQPTLYTALRLLGIKGALLDVFMGIVGIAATVLAMLVWKNTSRITLRGSAMVLGMFTFLPYFIQYDLMLLCIPLMLLVQDFIEYGCRTEEVILVIALWLLPLINMTIVNETLVQICPFVAMIALVFVLLRTKRTALSPIKIPAEAASEQLKTNLTSNSFNEQESSVG